LKAKKLIKIAIPVFTDIKVLNETNERKKNQHLGI